MTDLIGEIPRPVTNDGIMDAIRKLSAAGLLNEDHLRLLGHLSPDPMRLSRRIQSARQRGSITVFGSGSRRDR